MPIITSPSFPGSMVPVTRPTFPISSWSATIPSESFHQTGECAIERRVLDTGGAQVVADAAVAALKLLEYVHHRLGRRRADADAPREPEQERDDEARAVLAAEAVDDDGSLGRVGDRCDRLGELRPAPLEELEVDRPRRAERVGLLVADRVDLGPFGVLQLGQERDVHHLDGDVSRSVHRELAVEAEVDDPRDAVVDEGLPAGVGEVPDAVGPDDGAEPRRAPVLGAV